jgi:hypothetical protein
LIEAEIRGKVRTGTPIENQEDVLTSNVFGLFDLLGNEYLMEILQEAKRKGEEIDLHGKIKQVNLWPRDGFDGSEPDVVIDLKKGDHILVEVKFRSGESGEGQIKKYLDIGGKNGFKFSKVVYLTASYDSEKKLHESNRKYENKIYFLHWMDFNRKLKEFIKKNETSIEQRILFKIHSYLNHKGFSVWDGWKTIESSDATSKMLDFGFFKYSFFQYSSLPAPINKNPIKGFFHE